MRHDGRREGRPEDEVDCGAAVSSALFLLYILLKDYGRACLRCAGDRVVDDLRGIRLNAAGELRMRVDS